MSTEDIKKILQSVEYDLPEQVSEPTTPSLYSVEFNEFLAMVLTDRELLLSPWLPEAGLCMIHARPGVGKTHLSLGIAYAVATGGIFLNWTANEWNPPCPRYVSYHYA